MQKIDFLATDGILLNGLLYESRQKTKNVILAIHGMASNCFKKRDQIIAQNANKENIDYFCFNNRGSDLVKYITKNVHGKKEKKIGGTSYEEVLESYEDIIGAILKLKEMGYQNIYLQGHSLGCTKIVYTYNKLKKQENKYLLENIKGVILLSLIDIPSSLTFYLKDTLDSYVQIAKQKEKEGKLLELMPKEAFIHPISCKTFLRYAKDNQEIDFAKYGKDTKFEEINNITQPLFMRWGNNNEMILQKAEKLVENMNQYITNPNKDIDILKDANHSYTGKEEILAKQIIQFINNS